MKATRKKKARTQLPDELRPCIQCGLHMSVEAHEGLPVELFIEHRTSERLQAVLIRQGYDPPDAPIHDACWPTFKQWLQAKAITPAYLLPGAKR